MLYRTASIDYFNTIRFLQWFRQYFVDLIIDIEAYTRSFFNPLTAKLFNLNFHPLVVVSRWRDPQLQIYAAPAVEGLTIPIGTDWVLGL